jgi:hypothetical protein
MGVRVAVEYTAARKQFEAAQAALAEAESARRAEIAAEVPEEILSLTKVQRVAAFKFLTTAMKKDADAVLGSGRGPGRPKGTGAGGAGNSPPGAGAE